MEVEIKPEDLEDAPVALKVATKKRLRKESPDLDLSDSIEDLDTGLEAGEKEADTKTTAKRGKKKAGSADTLKKGKKSKEDATLVERANHLQKFHYLEENDIKKMQTDLLAWYDEYQRQMPWRKPSDQYKAKFGHKLVEGEYYDEKTSAFDQSYGALVSELMLQQTQVATVRAYFEKWMKRFPTVESLAEASLEDVNAVWAGLGYYRRAKLIHSCAQTIVEAHNGKMPTTSAELEKLPGLGPYTAGAIASVVFGEPAPIVDGNVVRVLTRFRAIGEDAKSSRVVKALWDLASAIVPKERAGDFNQAMMELGATLCTKANPNCSGCPIASQCAALAETKSKNWKDDLSKWGRESTADGRGSGETDIEDLCSLCPPKATQATSVTKYPVKGAKKEKKKMTTFVSVLRWKASKDEGEKWNYLFKKRPEGGLLGGFWEPPSLDIPQDGEIEVYDKVDKRMANEFLSGLFGVDFTAYLGDSAKVEVKDEDIGMKVDAEASGSVTLVRKFVGSYEHKFTHIDQSVLIEKIDLICKERPALKVIEGVEMKWVSQDEIPSLAISKVTTVCLERINKPGSTPKKTSAPPKKKIPVANSDKKQPNILSLFSKTM